MATTLLGDHVDATCPECMFAFSWDSQADDDARPAVCPNCGARFTPPLPRRVLAGDRVLVNRAAFEFRRPRRWETVIFHRGLDDQDLVVKRIVGLPGEDIEIIDGDIYVNGAIQRKNLREQRALRILVHDDDRAGPTPRWGPADPGSNWTRQNKRWVHAENAGDEIGWLVYNHLPITDYNFYNCGRFQRSEMIHPIADAAMSFRVVDIHGCGLLSLRATDGRDEFLAQIDPGAEKYVVRKNWKDSRTRVEVSGDLSGPLRDRTIEVSLFDRQFLLAIGGRTVAELEASTSGRPPGHHVLMVGDQPLAIGAQGIGIVVDRLRVYRDVYYTEPPSAASRAGAKWHVPKDEYFVLGDNSPLSIDSRTWTGDCFVSHKSLVGKPFVVIFPAFPISLGGWRIQVPDLARIRYIR